MCPKWWYYSLVVPKTCMHNTVTNFRAPVPERSVVVTLLALLLVVLLVVRYQGPVRYIPRANKPLAPPPYTDPVCVRLLPSPARAQRERQACGTWPQQKKVR